MTTKQIITKSRELTEELQDAFDMQTEILMALRQSLRDYREFLRNVIKELEK